MKKKWIIAILVSILVILITGYLVVLIKGKAIVAAGLEKQLHRKVNIGSVELSLLLGLHIRNLKVENLAEIKDLAVKPSLLGFLIGKPAFDEIKLVRPKFRIERLPDGSFSISDLFKKKEKSNSKKPFLLAKLVVRDGEITLVDRKVAYEGFVTKIEDIDIRISKVSFPPTSLVTKFKLGAVIPGREEQPKSRLTFQGWIDLLDKDMQADLNLKDLDLVNLEPYVGRYGFSNMESGNLNITSDMEAKNNDLTAQCKLEINNLKFKPQETEGSLIPLSPTKGVLDFLKGPGEKIVMSFAIRTKLDNPKINFGQLATGVAATAMEKVITSGVSTILQKIEGAPTEGEKPTGSLEDELKKGAEELKKGLEGIFKLETK